MSPRRTGGELVTSGRSRGRRVPGEVVCVVGMPKAPVDEIHYAEPDSDWDGFTLMMSGAPWREADARDADFSTACVSYLDFDDALC
jgi:hypothetical protein